MSDPAERSTKARADYLASLTSPTKGELRSEADLRAVDADLAELRARVDRLESRAPAGAETEPSAPAADLAERMFAAYQNSGGTEIDAMRNVLDVCAERLLAPATDEEVEAAAAGFSYSYRAAIRVAIGNFLTARRKAAGS